MKIEDYIEFKKRSQRIWTNKHRICRRKERFHSKDRKKQIESTL